MRNQRMGVVAVSVLALACLTVRPGFSQATPTWFDINPSRSNTDNDDPNGASGGRINHVGAASDMSKVYAATEWGGLYQSFDQGSTWVRINSYVPSATWDVKVDPRDSRRVYATSYFDGKVNPQSGISVSNDSGATWSTVNFPSQNLLNCNVPARKTQPSAWQISINAIVPRKVFIGTNCGLAFSSDSGVNWTFLDPSGGNAEQIYAVQTHGDSNVDVIGDSGYFRSTNDGTSWSAIPTQGFVGGNSGAGTSVALGPQNNNLVLTADQFNIFQSIDGGQTFPTSLPLPLRNGQSNQQGRIPFIKTNQLASSSQFDVWFGDTNLFKTTANTSVAPAPLWANVQDDGHWDVGDVMFDPRFQSGSCPRLFTNDGGVYVNTDTTNPDCQSPNWEQPVITPHATWVWGFDGQRTAAGVHAVTYGLQDNGGYAATVVAEGHNPPGPNWNNYFCCDVLHNQEGSGKILSLDGSSSSPPGCSNANPGCRAFRLKIRDLGGSGVSEVPNYPSTALFTRFESGRQVVRINRDAYAINLGDGVYFTNDVTRDPIAWTSLNAPNAATSGTGSLKIANFGGAPSAFYHTANGNPESPGVIFRSTLAGTTAAPGSNWIALPLPPNIGSVTAWDIDPTDGNRIIVSGINSISNNFEIWMTDDYGATPWTRLNGLENAMLNDLAGNLLFLNLASQGKNTGTFNFGAYWQPSMFAFNPLDSTTIAAGAVDAGVFLSLDDGTSWQTISNRTNPTSASPHIPRPLFAYFSPGRFRASTNSFDVWVGSRGAGVMKVVLETPAG